MCIYFLQPGHLEAEQNDRKVKRSKIKSKGVKSKNDRIIASVHATNCKRYLLHVNGNAKKIVLLLNGTYYSIPK